MKLITVCLRLLKDSLIAFVDLGNSRARRIAYRDLISLGVGLIVRWSCLLFTFAPQLDVNILIFAALLFEFSA